MCAMLDNVSNVAVPNDPNEYRLGDVSAADGNGVHRVVVILLKKAGNNSAATAASHLLRSFPSVNDVLMVGIAGSYHCPSDVGKHVRLGDCVASNEYRVATVRPCQAKFRQGRVARHVIPAVRRADGQSARTWSQRFF